MLDEFSRQLNRRPPIRFQKVWAVSWLSADEHEHIGTADWGTSTKEEAIDKAMREEELVENRIHLRYKNGYLFDLQGNQVRATIYVNERTTRKNQSRLSDASQRAI